MVTRQSQGLMKGGKLGGCGGGDGGASLCSDTNEDELKNVTLKSNIISMCNISVLQILDDGKLDTCKYTQKYHNLQDLHVGWLQGASRVQTDNAWKSMQQKKSQLESKSSRQSWKTCPEQTPT